MGELLVRLLLVFTLPTNAVLALSPVMLTGITVATILWTISYARNAQQRAMAARAGTSIGAGI